MRKKLVLAACLIGACLLGAWLVSMILFVPEASQYEEDVEEGGFSGVVVDGLTGAPIPGARVYAQFKADGHVVSEQVSDESGEFSLLLEDGSYEILAEALGYVRRGKREAGRSVEVLDKTHFVNGRIRLWPQAIVKGRVLAGERGIVASVGVTYESDASGEENYTFTSLFTDERGQFELGRCYAGIVSVSIAAEGFAQVRLQDIVLRSGQTLDLGDIPLREGVSLFGVVTDVQSMQGVSGAYVRAYDVNGALLDETRTTAGGEYRLAAIDLFRVQVLVSADGYEDIREVLQLSKDVNHAYHVGLRRTWGLRVMVQNDTGREPEQTHLTVVDLGTGERVYEATVGNGMTVMDALRGGPYLVRAESSDRATFVEKRAATGDLVRLQLRPFARIEVKVLSVDGAPLERGEYRYTYRPNLDEEAAAMAWRHFSGLLFEVGNLSPGYYRVEVKSGGSGIESAEFYLSMGDVRLMTLQGTEGGVLRGRVVLEGEHRGIRADIEVVGTGQTARSDADGQFTLDRLPSTTFDVRIRAGFGGEGVVFSGIAVPEGGVVEREFALDAEKYREERRATYEERRARGETRRGRSPWSEDGRSEGMFPPSERGRPPWGDGPPPWGDGPPPEGGSSWERPSGSDQWIEIPSGSRPPWGDGPPPWGDGPPPEGGSSWERTSSGQWVEIF